MGKESVHNSAEGEIVGCTENNIEFNRRLNACKHPRRVYNALMALAKPGIEQTDDVREKSQVIVRELTSFFDIPKSSEQPV